MKTKIYYEIHIDHKDKDYPSFCVGSYKNIKKAKKHARATRLSYPTWTPKIIKVKVTETREVVK